MIVEKLAKDDPRKTRVIQMQVGRILVSDEELQADLAAAGHAAVMEQIPEVTKAVVRRAIKGNIPAAKLAMEASGFHNPRVKHEHTGDIKVTIDNAPRPPVVQDDVVDAEVVE
jgi:tRNA(Ile2) C34 agmatinyltransferase TiaS